ncbi:MAG: phage holin family protein [Pseudomonadota bacterium]|nr:phage holin family protein [Sphingomonas sp.]MDQ3483622.1 phage holin family protein [Pseudomonadota bacterium]
MTPTKDEPFLATGDRPATRPASRKPASGDDDNIVDLVRQLAGQGSHLAEQQLTLVKAEIREATTDIKQAVAGMAGAAVAGIAGLGVTLMGLAFLLGQAIDNVAIATLIVGVATLAIAYFLYSSASRKMSTTHLTPDRTQHTLERTPDIARGDLHTEKTR